ncbi:UNVERIFIED_CONTAM: BTB/POZ domain-containing protein 6 [Trichonephila clavipes]
MSDLRLEKSMIVGACLIGASMSRIANLLGISRTTVLRVITVYTNLGKVNTDNAKTGLVARTAAFFNNSVLSDVEVQVKDDAGNYRTFYAHKLILAMAGNEFISLYNVNSKVIKILDSSPDTVYSMLRYLYTDEINLLCMEDAVNLFKLARNYSVRDLERICSKYILGGEINLDNLFAKYECALSLNFNDLLQSCRRFIECNTKAIFSSKGFCDASSAVVGDILSQNCLNVSSELVVISAAYKWSESECRRKGRPTEKLCMRDAIEPLLKHLRFLALTADEFCDLVETCEIFTSYESTLITRKILQPACDVKLPKYFCSITMPRQSYNSIQSSNVNYKPNFTDFNTQKLDIAKWEHTLIPLPKSESPVSAPPKIDSASIFQFNSTKKFTPVLKVMPQNVNARRTFDFPLEELQRNIGFTCVKDIKCNAVIRILKGSILVHGIELKIADLKSHPNETIEVLSCISGNFPSKVDSHALNLKNSTISLAFSEPYKVIQSNPIDIEITVEDLHLHRCCTCHEQIFELNCGLGVAVEISIKSNQSNGPDSLFLISRIIYSTA